MKARSFAAASHHRWIWWVMATAVILSLCNIGSFFSMMQQQQEQQHNNSAQAPIIDTSQPQLPCTGGLYSKHELKNIFNEIVKKGVY